MLLDIRYCEGYGWHCGRLLLWFFLLIVGVPLTFVGVFVEELFRDFTHLVIPFALCLPIVFTLLLYRRLRLKFRGQPFAVSLPAFFMDDMTVLLISRGHRHFRALVILEIFIWGSVVAAQLGIIGTFYFQRPSRPRPVVLQTTPPSYALQRTRHDAVVCNRGVPSSFARGLRRDKRAASSGWGR